MRRRMLAAALACTLLAGCGPVRTEPVEQETPRAGAPVIAYVPLDDRPDNAERVVYLAESLGYELAMPERDLYRTRLDGQPPNENGTQYGDRGALYEWVAKQEAAGCDRYILSLDQLLSGGLVSSRAMTGENPVTLSSGETLVEAELLTAVIDLLAADENNRIWLLDTVMRLAATTGYGGFGLNEYNALRTYGMAPRPHLEGTDLTIICCGIAVLQAMNAARVLAETDGLSVRVINMHTIKPIDREAILKAVTDTRRILTIEEHNVIGGLGDAVGNVIAESGKGCVFKKHGLQDTFAAIGYAEDLYAYYGLDANGVVDKVREMMGMEFEPDEDWNDE